MSRMNVENTAHVLLGYMLLISVFNAVAGQSDNMTTANDTVGTTTGVFVPGSTIPPSYPDTSATTSDDKNVTTAAVATVVETTSGSGQSGSGMETTEPTTPATQATTTSVPVFETTTRPQTSQAETTTVAKTTSSAPPTATNPPTTFTTASTTPTTPKPIVTTKSTTTPKSSTTTAPSSALLPAIAVLIVVFLLLILTFLLWWYCRGKDLPCFSSKSRLDMIEIVPRKPSNGAKFASIAREEFEAHHKRKIADDGRGYREEFGGIRTEGSSMSAAKNPKNEGKNRYDNVLPWDSSRVTLSTAPDGDQCEDYINANFVPGYLQEKKFIACQGPMEGTCADFWKMIWEKKCATIVMVANVIEAKKPKCEQYWPGEDTGEVESAKYGPYLVTTVDVKIRNYYVTRTLKLQWLDFPPRMIRQLHYTAWPDFGVPKNLHELLLFRRRVVAANPPHSGPIVVHCSAGVGRTGTFILLDAALEQLQAEDKVDLFSFLTNMRKYRMMLVQTEAQYTFAHAAVLEHIKYGETEVAVKRFKAQLQSLSNYAESSDESVLEEQFSSLLKVQMNKDNMKHGRQSIKKNRVLQIIPYDNNRVTLPLKPGQERTDYINASLIDGFREKGTYIATQGPLADTCADFWMMVWIYQSQNLVMLTGLLEKGHEMCAQYWPKEVGEEQLFGDINVKYVSKDEDDDVVDYIVREFVVTNTVMTEEPERKIRQFHYTGWPEVGPPTDAHGLIEIANRLSPEDKDGHNKPSIVHCSSGGGRTGVFIALNILMEQADNDGMIDVFQTVKSLRAQRPHIIQSQDQLHFLYMAVLQYLETNQLAGDNTTLSSGITSSIGDQSESVTAFPGGASPSKLPPLIKNGTPHGSMSNKLDLCSATDEEFPIPESELDGAPSDGDVPEKTPAATSADDENGNSSSSQSDFEIVNENAKGAAVNA